MKTKLIVIVSLLLGTMLGVIMAGVFASISSKHMMVKEFKSPFDFDKTVDVMVDRINAADGWVVTDIVDQNEAVLGNGGETIGNFKIIKYCSGLYSSQMLKADERKMIGVMMPKSFAVYQKSDGQVFVSTMNGAVMGKMLGGETEDILEDVSLEVEEMMRFINLKYTLF